MTAALLLSGRYSKSERTVAIIYKLIQECGT
jgi:hypothetical protein